MLWRASALGEAGGSRIRSSLPIAALVSGALVLTGCGSATHRSAPATTKPQPAPTTTPTPTSPPPTGAVDTQQIEAISFISLKDGFGLTDGAVAETQDGGSSWRVVATEGATELPSLSSGAPPNGIAFPSAKEGFVWNALATGPSLAVTADGGHSWNLAQGPTDVQEVMADGSSVWAISSTPPDSGDATTPTLWQSSDGGMTWAPSPTPLPSVEPMVLSTDRVDASTAFVVEGAQSGGDSLLETTDAGHSWVTRTVPALGCGKFGTVVAAAQALDPWLACSGEPGASNQDKTVYRSTDSGQTWTVAASNFSGRPPVGSIPEGGYLDQLYVASKATAYIALGRGPIIETTNGGTTWRTATPDPNVDAFGAVLDPPISPTTSVGLVADQIWRTTNGTTWAPAR